MYEQYWCTYVHYMNVITQKYAFIAKLSSKLHQFSIGRTVSIYSIWGFNMFSLQMVPTFYIFTMHFLM